MIGHIVRISAVSHLADSLAAAIDGFLVFCRAKNLSDNTLTYYSYRLKSFSKFLDNCIPGTMPKDVTKHTVRQFIMNESERCSPSTANHSITTLRAFFNFLQSDGHIDYNPMNGVTKVKCKKKVIETFNKDQLEALIGTCRKDFVGIRDRAMILTLVDCGLRASELCTLGLEDICWKDQTMLVLGKGNRERIVPFGDTTRQSLTQYMSRRPDLETNAIFVSCYRQPLDRYRLRAIINERCKKAGITGVRCSPHTLRHTCAVNYLRNGGDLFSLQKLLGHCDLTMTRRYVELSQNDVVERHRRFSPADHLLPPKTTSGRKRIV